MNKIITISINKRTVTVETVDNKNAKIYNELYEISDPNYAYVEMLKWRNANLYFMTINGIECAVSPESSRLLFCFH